MKRKLTMFAALIISLYAMAEAPNLATEKIFQKVREQYPKATCMINKSDGKLVRSLSFTDIPELQKKIKDAIDIDRKRANSESQISQNGEILESIKIINNGKKINICHSINKNGENYFVITGPIEAFE